MEAAGAWTHHSRSNARGTLAGQRRGPALLAAFGLALAAVVALGLASLSGPAPPASNQPAVEAESNLAELPLAFEQNRGQASRGIDFLARSSAGNFRVGPKGMTASLSGPGGRGAVLSLSLLGSSAAPPQALERLPGRVNYLIGGDPSRWRTGISTFSRIRYRGVWPGVDLDWYGDGRRLEYD